MKDPSAVDLLPFECDVHAETTDLLDVALRSTFMELFINTFDSRLLPGWHQVTTEENRECVSSIASTLHLTHDKFGLDVDVDLCLCLPIRADDFKGALSIPDDVKSKFQRLPYYSSFVI